VDHKINILVQYHGGGYEGCYWEWNFFFIDNDGKFHDIYSEGRAAVKTMKDAKELLAEDSSQIYVYWLDDESEKEDFIKNANKGHVGIVMKWFEDFNDPDAELYMYCDECGVKETDTNNLHVVSTKGCGGTAITVTEVVCDGCWWTYNCARCGEYDKTTKEVEEHDYDVLCESCSTSLTVAKEVEDHAVMLHSALLIDKPDFFSREMSWYWN